MANARKHFLRVFVVLIYSLSLFLTYKASGFSIKLLRKIVFNSSTSAFMLEHYELVSILWQLSCCLLSASILTMLWCSASFLVRKVYVSGSISES